MGNVMKVKQEFIQRKIIDRGGFDDFNEQRGHLRRLGLIGEENGVGYGNISRRDDHYRAGFYITSTQTGNVERLDRSDTTLVVLYCPDSDIAYVIGVKKASSELPSHAAVYYELPEINCVVHVHSKPIWEARERLGLPTTDERIEYGTPAMYHEVRRLVREDERARKKGAFAMGGHRNGIITFDKDTLGAVSLALKYNMQANE